MERRIILGLAVASIGEFLRSNVKPAPITQWEAVPLSKVKPLAGAILVTVTLTAAPPGGKSLRHEVLDRGQEDCAYAIGMWDNRRCIGFRWNGTDDRPLGNPQSRGLPTWTILDRKLHRAVTKLVRKENPAKLQIVQAFFGKPVEDEED